MVRHALEGQARPFCVLANQFKRKEAVVWRIRVLDQTGRQMDDMKLKNVVVELTDGQKLNAKFGGHPPHVVYKVVATDLDGRTQTWAPFKRAPTQLIVIAGEPTMKQ